VCVSLPRLAAGALDRDAKLQVHTVLLVIGLASRSLRVRPHGSSGCAPACLSARRPLCDAFMEKVAVEQHLIPKEDAVFVLQGLKEGFDLGLDPTKISPHATVHLLSELHARTLAAILFPGNGYTLLPVPVHNILLKHWVQRFL